jgi:uncharacterized protein (TIGR00266 family)
MAMVKYEIRGGDVQYLHTTLDNGESVFVEPGHLIYKTPDSRLETGAGGLRGALSHMLSGSAVFLLKIEGPGNFGTAGFLPGKVFEVKLNNSSIFAEFNAFLCMDSTIKYSTKFAGYWQAIFGGEGIFLEEFTGTGSVMLHGHGQVIEYELKDGEEIQAELSHVLAFESSVSYNVSRIGGIKTMILGGMEGEGFFFASMHGPGKVWLHSISLLELSAKLIRR